METSRRAVRRTRRQPHEAQLTRSVVNATTCRGAKAFPQTRHSADRICDVLAVRLILFGVMALVGNVLGSALRYPDIGAAVLFPPYAALTAALIVSRRRDWIWFILVGAAAHFVTHWPQWSVSWVLLADVANIARALAAAALLCGPFAGSTRLNGIREFLL